MVLRQYRGTVLSCLAAGALLLGLGVLPLLAPRGAALWGPRWRCYPVLLLPALLAGVGLSAWGVALLARPGWHPLLGRLAAFGPPRAVAAAIDEELARGEVVRVGSRRRSPRLHDEVLLTRSWALQFTAFGALVVRLEDVVWVRKVVFRAFDPEAPYRESLAHFVEVKVRPGGGVYFGGTEADVERLLAELLARQPRALRGFDSRWEGPQNWSRQVNCQRPLVTSLRAGPTGSITPPVSHQLSATFQCSPGSTSQSTEGRAGDVSLSGRY
jgi:hypothetical protein